MYSFRQALDAVMPHVGADVTLPMLQNVKVDVDPAGHAATMLATDRYSMVRVRFEVHPSQEGEPFAFVVRAAALRAAAARGHDAPVFALEGSAMRVSTLATGASFTVPTDNLAGFPDIERLIPAADAPTFALDGVALRADLLARLGRIPAHGTGRGRRAPAAELRFYGLRKPVRVDAGEDFTAMFAIEHTITGALVGPTDVTEGGRAA